MNAASPKFESSKISFPTDCIRFSQMRRLQPGLFVEAGISTLVLTDLDIVSTHAREVSLAAKAFARTVGLPDPFPRTTREQIVTGLLAPYKDYGLCGGIHECEALARKIEAAAFQQAEVAMGVARTK